MQVDASERPFKAQELRKVVQVLGTFMAASAKTVRITKPLLLLLLLPLLLLLLLLLLLVLFLLLLVLPLNGVPEDLCNSLPRRLQELDAAERQRLKY